MLAMNASSNRVSGPAPHAAHVPGDRLMRAGLVTTTVGLMFLLIAIVPLVVPSVTLPSVFWGLSMITGVGLAMVLVGLWQAARGRGRRAAAAVGQRPS